VVVLKRVIPGCVRNALYGARVYGFRWFASWYLKPRVEWTPTGIGVLLAGVGAVVRPEKYPVAWWAILVLAAIATFVTLWWPHRGWRLVAIVWATLGFAFFTPLSLGFSGESWARFFVYMGLAVISLGKWRALNRDE